MDQIVKLIVNNPYVALILIILSIVGFMLSIIFQKTNKKKKSLSYTLVSTTIIENKKALNKDVEILYKGTPVNSIISTSLHIWNSGNIILTPSDLYKGHELSINIDTNGDFLSIEKIKESSDTCNVNIEPITIQKAQIKFDYLEKKQGAIINIYHTSESIVPIKINGKIIEGKIINKSPQLEIASSDILSIANDSVVGVLQSAIKAMASGLTDSLKIIRKIIIGK